MAQTQSLAGEWELVAVQAKETHPSELLGRSAEHLPAELLFFALTAAFNGTGKLIYGTIASFLFTHTATLTLSALSGPSSSTSNSLLFERSERTGPEIVLVPILLLLSYCCDLAIIQIASEKSAVIACANAIFFIPKEYYWGANH